MFALTALLPKPVPVTNVVSYVPLVFSRTILFLVDPLYATKSPTAITLPSDCILISLTIAPAPAVPTLNVASRAPLLANLASLGDVTPLTVVKAPPIIILLSDYIATLYTL